MGLHHLEARAEARMRDDFPSAASLVAEVERLRREIAVARARIGELEARADIDPLLDILNRRGFERELKRALAYVCLLYTSPSPRDPKTSRMPSSA